MIKNIALAGILLSSLPVMADDLPNVCKTAVNYAVEAANLRFMDGSFGPNSDPKTVVLHKNFKAFPITRVTSLGGCEDPGTQLPAAWCRVAGGMPEVFKVEVAKVDGGTTVPADNVVVTFNRGGCWVDSVEAQ